MLLWARGQRRCLLSIPLDPLKNKSGRFWHCRVPKARLQGAEFYAYTVDGPGPEGRFAWNCFDPQKVLLDPYASSVYFPAGFDRNAARHPGSNAGKAPLAVLSACEQPIDPSKPSRGPRHGADAVIYELHVRAFTMDPSSGLSPVRRGTYLGLMDKIPYLQDLGVTIVELMPIFQYDPQEGSAWGYMPMNFFSPHIGYATAKEDDIHQPQHEFRTMLAAFHAAGMEVVLDVVYNHSCEGGESGPLYSFKGVDNSTYYQISDREGDRYENFSGAGNTLNCANRQVRRLIMDSLRHWAKEGVDGFRFDLASVFSRGIDGSINMDDPRLFSDIISDPGPGRAAPDRRALGTSRLTSWAANCPAASGPSGTAATATSCAALCAGMPAWWGPVMQPPLWQRRPLSGRQGEQRAAQPEHQLPDGP